MNIGIITGGESSEREISLLSGKNVYSTLLEEKKHTVDFFDFPKDRKKFLTKSSNLDFVFIIIHGVGGEDGRIAAFLDTLDIPYQCGDFSFLNISIDKYLTKIFWKDAEIPVAHDEKIYMSHFQDFDIFQEKIKNFWFPCVLKSPKEGSSQGVFIIKNISELREKFSSLKKYEDFLLEEFISGREFTIGILEDTEKNFITLPIVEIIPPEGKDFDYENKYNGQTQEIFPTDLHEDLVKKIEVLAKKAFYTLGGSKYGRLDFILDNGIPKFLEINTIPGFTWESLFPKAAKKYGISFSELLNLMIKIEVQK